MAIVSDGHGGASYFRSAFGARAAVEVTAATLRQFVQDVDTTLFSDLPFTEYGGLAKDKPCPTALKQTMLQLFSCIYVRWRYEIAKDCRRPLTEWEKAHVKPQYFG